MAREADHVAAIDLLRFLCAAGVVAHHLAPFATMDAAGRVLPGQYSWFGWVGVQLFFVISGFVIAQSSEGSDAGRFLRRRVLRLVPAAWLCASLTALAQFVIGGLSPAAIVGRWAAALAFVPLAWPIDGSYWTLSIELCFYLIVALMLALKWNDGRALERLAFVIGGPAIAFWAWAAASGQAGAFLEHRFDWRVGMVPFGLYFGLGILLQRIRIAGATPWRAIGAALLFAAGCGQILLRAWHLPSAGVALYPHGPVLAFALGVGAIVAADRLQLPLLRLFGRERLALLGLMTYPLYLLHHVVGDTIVLMLAGAGVPAPIAATAGVVAVVGLAWYVTVRAEPPLRAWLAARLDRLSRRRGPARDNRRSAFPPAG